MFATAVIMFREVLEASLIIAIVLGACRGIAGSVKWIGGGVFLGLLAASVVAILANVASSVFSGNNQALVNAAILLCAVVMLALHNVWMCHGRQHSTEIAAAGLEVKSGNRPLAALLVIAMLAVMREGSEAVLFLWAIATGGEQGMNMVLGGMGGVAAGIMAGMMLYFGLLRITARYFFQVTSWLMVFVASGLAAQSAGYLNQAGLLQAWDNELWDTSNILSQESMLGQLLHILVGYTARPSGMEAVFFAGTFLMFLFLMRFYGKNKSV